RHPPTKRDPALARHGEQVAVPTRAPWRRRSEGRGGGGSGRTQGHQRADSSIGGLAGPCTYGGGATPKTRQNSCVSPTTHASATLPASNCKIAAATDHHIRPIS